MIDILTTIGAVGLSIQAVIGLGFFISCIWEHEPRAGIFAFHQFLIMVSVLVFFIYLAYTGFFKTPIGIITLIAGYLLTGSCLFIVFRKGEENAKALAGSGGYITGDVKKFDERETIFSRVLSLRPGNERYDAFYRDHPGYKDYDDKRRAKGGPMGDAGSIDRPGGDVNVAMMTACMAMPERLRDRDAVRPEAHPSLKQRLKKGKIEISPEDATIRIKGFSKSLGADLVGIAKVDPNWIYSHSGRVFSDDSELYGREIPPGHKWAVVFAEEMSPDMVRTAPHTPTSIESMRNYSKGAYISIQIASFIANLGYSATANHFRYYEAIMVPLAVDAGLGELSRMGYLITKEYGPRVRLSAVTTDIPLVPDKPVDIGVDDFCRFCKKCAVCCPSQSIPKGEKTVVNGTERWKLDAETCFEYWGKIGTDCNRCMMVCPWSHARTFPHRIILFMITRNPISRRIFSVMDNIFYGKRPKPKGPPLWAGYH